MKKIVCIVILILAITGLLNGISYLISGISARGIGGVNYGRVIFPLLGKRSISGTFSVL